MDGSKEFPIVVKTQQVQRLGKRKGYQVSLTETEVKSLCARRAVSMRRTKPPGGARIWTRHNPNSPTGCQCADCLADREATYNERTDTEC